MIDRRAALGRRLERLHAQQLADLRADHFAAIRGQRRADDFVLQVQMEFAAADDELDKIREILGQHLAGVRRHFARQIRRTQDRDAVLDDRFIGLA